MDLEKEIKKIQERNKRVELDKAWETSWTRKICIMILTYIVVIIYSYVIRKYDNIFLSSLVPVIGFTLSTLSLKLVRKIWENNNKWS
ncbi:unknown [Clostridium sp. CAG:417]|nr:unknown [Clostridium sp. CAG:417]